MAQASDRQILDRAIAERRIVATLDADFHTILALSGAQAPSVIRMRIQGLKGRQLSILLQEILSRCREDLRAGAMITVEPHRIRTHRLPVPR